jgi:iron complex transport system substrate-binding protein
VGKERSLSIVKLFKSSLLITSLLFLSFLWPIRDSFSATFTDETGRKVEVKGPPRRIVSLAPSVTEILFALGLGERVVGVSSCCDFPPAALKIEKVGDYINPSLEKIVALRPDLVIGIAEGDLKAFMQKLASLKIPVYITGSRNFSAVLASIQNLGKVTFSPRSAEKITQRMKERIQAVEARVRGRPRPRVLPVLNLDPLMSAGEGTFVDDLVRLAGGRNLAGKGKGKYPLLGVEEVFALDPEVIIFSSMKSQDADTERCRRLEQWKTLSAVREGRIYVLDADLIYRPSPRIVDGLEETARALHPQVFKSRRLGHRSRGQGSQGSGRAGEQAFLKEEP